MFRTHSGQKNLQKYKNSSYTGLCRQMTQASVRRKILLQSTMQLEVTGDKCFWNYGNNLIHSFIHSAVCLTTSPQPFPKRVLHRMRSSASSFSSQYTLLSFRPSSSCLLFLPRLPVTYSLPSTFPSVPCFRTQVLCQLRLIQLPFLLFAVRRKFYVIIHFFAICPTVGNNLRLYKASHHRHSTHNRHDSLTFIKLKRELVPAIV